LPGFARLKDCFDFLGGECSIKYFHFVNQPIEFCQAFVVRSATDVEWYVVAINRAGLSACPTSSPLA
jgi:hypothetical protein